MTGFRAHATATLLINVPLLISVPPLTAAAGVGSGGASHSLLWVLFFWA